MSAELGNLYSRFRQRLEIHVPGSCADVTVLLPIELTDELAFYRLVNWGYVLLNEAARIPLSFAIRLPPLRAGNEIRNEVSGLRTYIAHNLNLSSSSDRKKLAAAHRWFKSACGVGTPLTQEHFRQCSITLAGAVADLLRGALEACDALDDSTDGPRLIEDLRGRIDLNWDAHRFDPIASACADRLGHAEIDVVALRKQNLENWRAALASAEESHRERAVLLAIETSLLAAIREALPVTSIEMLSLLAKASPSALGAALLILKETRVEDTSKALEIVQVLVEAAALPSAEPGLSQEA